MSQKVLGRDSLLSEEPGQDGYREAGCEQHRPPPPPRRPISGLELSTLPGPGHPFALPLFPFTHNPRSICLDS